MRVANANGDLCSVENASGQDAVVPAFSCATGSVTVSEGGVPVDKGTFPLGSRGYSDDLFIQLTGGTHQLALTYAGDPSFGASTNTTSLVVTPAVTTAVLTSSSASVNGGDSLTMTVV